MSLKPKRILLVARARQAMGQVLCVLLPGLISRVVQVQNITFVLCQLSSIQHAFENIQHNITQHGMR